jgi:hypothetical protein
MKYKIGDHLQDVNSTSNGIVTDYKQGWYMIENDEIGLVNHWVPEYNLELHKQTLRDNVLNELGI